MDIEKLQALAIDALEDVKAQDIVLFDTTKLTSLFERIIVASGNSNRQTKALAASVRDKIKEAGGDVISIEGEDTGEWVLVDLGDLIVQSGEQLLSAAADGINPPRLSGAGAGKFWPSGNHTTALQ